MALIQDLDNHFGELINFIQATQTVLGESPTQQAAIVSLTDNTTGTGDDTLVDVGAAFSQATLNNNFADLAAKIEEILVALRAHGLIAS